ncbi:23S rRNA pseudouridine(2604) synthase RluF [Avrilella dinanensis]|uniref:23S rRNA pseudouridine(2604) synthase RluF n=1 Tax=Avrilella dinanensis TaxID=2008672 RepID=UPI00240A706D|nr:23S rRNA pseudouridine(2604) synthase RluF [Avrilella dinanensis]
MQETKRINKYLSETGYCSRRQADTLVSENRVTINGKPAEMGAQVSDQDVIEVDGKPIRKRKNDFVYLAFNKPIGIECTTNTKVKDNVVDYINYPERIFPIGRLDKDSEGLLLLTNDGDIVNKILRARNNHEKEYIVKVDKPVNDRFITRMSLGVPILDTMTKKCKVEKINAYTFKIVLTQGLNRQIRRMCEHLGYEVKALKRVRIINITLDVPLGKYRKLSDKEMNELNRLISDSSKTEEVN